MNGWILLPDGSVRPVELTLEDHVLTAVADDGDRVVAWETSEMAMVQQATKHRAAHFRAKGDARILAVKAGPTLMTIQASTDHLRTLGHAPSRWPILIKYLAGAAIGAAFLAYFSIEHLPGIIIDRIPYSFEKRVGDAAMETLFGDVPRCETKQGRAALDQMTQRILSGGSADVRAVDIEVLNLSLVNAFALPGGHVVLTRGLLESAEEPEEIAGVVAHEIGHVIDRHSMQSLVRQAGLYVAISVFTEGQADIFGAMVEAGGLLAVLAQSKEAENEADAWAATLMRDSAIPIRPLAEFMDREFGGGPDHWLSTHPATHERVAFLNREADSQRGTRRLQVNLRDLSEMCENAGDPAPFSMFGF